MLPQETENIVNAKSLATTISGGAVAAYGGLSSTDWAAILGLTVGFIGLVMQWWDKRRTDVERRARMAALAVRQKQEQERHEAYMKSIKKEGNIDLYPALDSLGLDD